MVFDFTGETGTGYSERLISYSGRGLAGRPKPFNEGEEFWMNVSGICNKSYNTGKPYGWKHKVRCIVDDINLGVNPPQPADEVRVRIERIEPTSARVTVVENMGCFLSEGLEFEVIVTERSYTNARNCISDPQQRRGGIYGTFTVIDNCRLPDFRSDVGLERDDSGFYKTPVKIRYIHNIPGKKRFIKTELIDPDGHHPLRREPGKSLFYAMYNSVGMHPTVDRIAGSFKGIPKKQVMMLHVSPEDGRKVIISNDRFPDDLSHFDYPTAIKSFLDRSNRIGLNLPLVAIDIRADNMMKDYVLDAAKAIGLEPEELDMKSR